MLFFFLERFVDSTPQRLLASPVEGSRMTLDTEPMYCAEQINIPDNLGEILKAYAEGRVK